MEGCRKHQHERERRGGRRDERGTEKKEGQRVQSLRLWERAIFMDVYLSASPTGNSYFPLGNCWSAGQETLHHGMQKGQQHSLEMKTHCGGGGGRWGQSRTFFPSVAAYMRCHLI